MLNIAYLANEFPVAVEPYVVEEIRELRKRGICVTATSARRPQTVPQEFADISAETSYLQPFSFVVLAYAALLCVTRCRVIADLFLEALSESEQTTRRRLRAIFHTFLGVYYAAAIRHQKIQHIHVHHGYFASWMAMTAARLLGISYSMTLHGSDLLLHRAYINLKLRNCKFCLTVSEFNRQHILSNYPEIPPEKIKVQRMGVEMFNTVEHEERRIDPCLVMLSVGRLHPVKDHAFLLRACKQLKTRGVRFVCWIAGEGMERNNLEKLLDDLDLREQVILMGHLSKARLETCYSTSDLVVLTSRSEGQPLVLMEAMAHGRTILAPAITGIPELVIDGKTGFLYQAGSVDDFVAKIETILTAQSSLNKIRQRARQHVFEHFNRTKNLATFGSIFPALIADNSHENSLLQQI